MDVNRKHFPEYAQCPLRKHVRSLSDQNARSEVVVLERVGSELPNTNDEDESESDGEIERALLSSREITTDILHSKQLAPQLRQGDRVMYSVRGAAGPIDIRENDEASLRANKWLTDPVVNCFGHSVCQGISAVCFIESFFFHNHRDECVSANPAIHIRNSGASPHCQLMLVPINTANSHWTLIAAKPQSREMYHYDSLPQEESRQRVQALFGLLGNAIDLMFRRDRVPEWRLIPNGNSPRQTNNSDCGVYVCYMMEHLVQLQEVNRGSNVVHDIDFRGTSVGELRARILQTLRSQRSDETRSDA